MDNDVRQRILQISADFYRVHADSFAHTRQGAWDSWHRVWAEVRALVVPSDVLDLGCGNGRFATFLRSAGVADAADTTESVGTTYLGVDSEEQFIRKARQSHPDELGLSGRSIPEHPIPGRSIPELFKIGSIEDVLEAGGEFDVVVCFGVFHHLPGQQYRSQMLNMFTRVLRPGGVAVISLWQPKLLKNFDTLVCLNPDVAGLEPNDFFLSWQGDVSYPRYCHHFDDDEIEDLVSQCQLELVTQFQGTGNDQSNRYLILQKALAGRQVARSRKKRYGPAAELTTLGPLMDRTLVILKPDAFERGLVGTIIDRFERKGLVLVAAELRKIDADTARRHYAEHQGKPFFNDLIVFITRNPSMLLIIEGPLDTYKVVRGLMGATDPAQAAPGTIRGDLAVENPENLVHGSDSVESAEHEIDLFFPGLA